jgi:hypothetical protein
MGLNFIIIRAFINVAKKTFNIRGSSVIYAVAGLLMDIMT